MNESSQLEANAITSLTINSQSHKCEPLAFMMQALDDDADEDGSPSPIIQWLPTEDAKSESNAPIDQSAVNNDETMVTDVTADFINKILLIDDQEINVQRPLSYDVTLDSKCVTESLNIILNHLCVIRTGVTRSKPQLIMGDGYLIRRNPTDDTLELEVDWTFSSLPSILEEVESLIELVFNNVLTYDVSTFKLTVANKHTFVGSRKLDHKPLQRSPLKNLTRSEAKSVNRIYVIVNGVGGYSGILGDYSVFSKLIEKRSTCTFRKFYTFDEAVAFYRQHMTVHDYVTRLKQLSL
jgi:hypothetical protein